MENASHSAMSVAHATARIVEYLSPGKLAMREVPLPDMDPEDMLIRVALCGVDGSELHMYRGELGWINDLAPLTFGDEIVGTVEAIGESASRARSLSVGDRVILEARWPCSNCDSCRAGQYYLCDQKGKGTGYGITSNRKAPQLWGGYATHVFVPKEALAYKLPDGLSDGAALIGGSPLANGMRWVTSAGVKPGDHVAIVGPGPQGLCCAIAAMELGAKVTMIGLETDELRLDLARQLGVTTTLAMARDADPDLVAQDLLARSGQANVVIDLAGVAPAKRLAFRLLAKMGTFVNVAISSPAIQQIDWVELLMKEIRLLSFASHPNFVEAGLQLALDLQKRGVDLADWVSETYPLEEAETALKAAAHELDGRPIKVALRPGNVAI